MGDGLNTLNELERAVLDQFLAGGHPVLATLRRQVEHARLVTRGSKGDGFSCHFEVDASAPILQKDFELGDVHAELEGLTNGAGFLLFVRGGRLDTLQGFSYFEPWPSEIQGFALRYTDPLRTAELAKLNEA
ncbi:MAG: hypothetical protein RL685_6406 [Pseudomonadota bacterium]|jgi:hypothetical protein